MKHSIYIYFLVFMLVSCLKPIPRKPITKRTTSVMDASVSFNKSLITNQENVILKFIEKDSVNNYIASSNGFWYAYNVKSSNKYSPKFGDQVLYTNEVLDLNGKTIYSAQEAGVQSYAIDKQEIVEGLRNGLKLLHEGDVVTFLFPSHKVYGYVGDQKQIGINQPLIYKVQLNKINKKNESN